MFKQMPSFREVPVGGLGVLPKDRVYAGGSPYFDERTGKYRPKLEQIPFKFKIDPSRSRGTYHPKVEKPYMPSPPPPEGRLPEDLWKERNVPWTPSRGRDIIPPPKFGLDPEYRDDVSIMPVYKPFPPPQFGLDPEYRDANSMPVYKPFISYAPWEGRFAGLSNYNYGMGNLGWSFKKAVKQLTSAGRKTFSSPKKIRKELGKVTKTGLKLMKIALKPKGAKMLAKKGGLKTAIQNPNKFIADYNQKLHERNQQRKEAEQQMPPPETQPPQEQEAYRLVDIANAAETKAIETMNPADMMAAGDAALAVAKAIRAAGLGEDLAKEWEVSAQEWFKYAQDLIPPESPEGQIQIDDPYTPILPEQPSPTSGQPYSDYYPAEGEYYEGEEFYREEMTLMPEEEYYQEPPKVKAGTEWWYYGAKEQPFPAQSEVREDEYEYEYEVREDESIIPQADWYRDLDPLPSPYSEERYYQQDYPYNGYESEYESELEGLGNTSKRYYPIAPRPISPYYARVTKTSKYLPQEIAKLPFPLSRSVTFGRRRNF